MKNTILSCCCLLSVLAAAAPAISADATKPSLTLHSRRATGQTDRVAVLMEVGGEFKDRVEGKQQRTQMSGVDRLTYQEKTLEAGRNRLRAVRYYEKAESAVKFKDDALRCSLSPQRRLVGAAVDLPAETTRPLVAALQTTTTRPLVAALHTTLFALRGPLRREELEVIDVLGNSLLLDYLLPDGPTAAGQTWKPADKAVSALLGLDAASRCDVQCTLTEITDAVARFELAGQVEGPVNDTTARVQLKGKCRFDRRIGRIDWFALLSKEDRGVSQVADGFEVVVRLQMTIAPQEPSPELAEANLSGPSLEPTPELTQLCYQPPGSHWRLSHDRHWYLGSDDRDVAVLKRIGEGTLIGQCNASSLPERDPDKLVSLEEFQADVRQALGESFGEFVEAGQSVNPAKHRVLRVVVHGTAHNKSADVPIRWIYYHVADQQGHQAALTFTVQQEHVERFADADKPVVESLRFAEAAKRD